MSRTLVISRPINQLGNQHRIFLSEPKPSKSRRLTITKPTQIESTQLTIHSPSLSKFEETNILDCYLSKKKKDIYELPDIRIKVMKGKFFYDLQTGEYQVDPRNWWVSEKLDGIRAIWTGQKLKTRSGRTIQAPDWFIRDFPENIALDGELYLGRNQFHQVQMTVMDSHQSRYRWEKIKYHVFDIPDSANILTFEEVQVILNHHLPKSKYLQPIVQTKIHDLNHLLELQKILVSQGAEGTMLRRPESSYQVGETNHLLKFKSNLKDNQEMVHLLDDDAVIIGYKYNYEVLKADHTPTIKSLMVQWVDREKFSLNPEFTVSHHLTQSDKRGNFQSLFPIGQRIKIHYSQLFESQKPRFPRYAGWVMDQ